MSLELVCCLRLKDSLAFHYLFPLARHPLVSRIWIVRHAPIEYAAIPNAELVLVNSIWKPVRFGRMIAACHDLARRPGVKGFVSFNPIPYGLFSYTAARRYGKAIHFGFIGSDWDMARRSWVRDALRRLTEPDFVTATGEGIRREMMQVGFPGDRIRVLPHAIDLERFSIGPSGSFEHDCVYVGSLIQRKQIDVILQAFAMVVEKHCEARLCIVGDGPLKSQLISLAESLGLSESVKFVGYQKDVRPYFAASRMVIIASRLEGFPFALVEGICSGAIPIATPVASIPEILEDRMNCLLFPIGDHAALADRITRILDDDDLANSLRLNALRLRDNFSYDAATNVWTPWLESLAQN